MSEGVRALILLTRVSMVESGAAACRVLVLFSEGCAHCLELALSVVKQEPFRKYYFQNKLYNLLLSFRFQNLIFKLNFQIFEMNFKEIVFFYNFF